MRIHGLTLGAVLVLTGCVDRAMEGGGGGETTAATDTDATTTAGTTTGGGSTTGDDTGTTGGTSTGPVTTSGSTTGVDVEFCEDACSDISLDSCFGPELCMVECEEIVTQWPPEVADAFAACAQDNPLCFETIEGCMLRELYPERTVHRISARGTGFGEVAGAEVHALHDGGEESFSGSTFVAGDGTFGLIWNEPVMIWDANGPLLLLYIDVDADGLCDPETDITEYLYTTWNGDFEDPAFNVTLDAAEVDGADFVCSYFN